MNLRPILIQILDLTYRILYCLHVFLRIIFWCESIRLIILLYNTMKITNMISNLNITDVSKLITNIMNITNITNITENTKIEL
jgi:hypothetical protein